MKKIIFYLMFAVSLYSQAINANSQQLLQLIDYLGVDYAGAVEQGRVINEAEYKEMLDFSAGIHQQLAALPDNEVKDELLMQGAKLSQWVRDKKPAQQIKSLTDTLHSTIISVYNITVTPYAQPELKQAALLYKQHCASCHGVTGEGNGAAALGMDPPPINFHDINRYQQRTLYGLFSTITQGVAGTGMTAFTELTDKQRWSLAFYVGSLAVKNDIKPNDVNHHPLADMTILTTITPAQAKAQYGEQGEQVMTFLRSHPDALFTDKTSPIEFTKQKLRDSFTAYQKQKNDLAYQLAVSAYLDGYELIEKNIGALDKQLMFDIEAAMTDLRNKIRSTASIDSVDNQITTINKKLDVAAALLTSKSLSKEATFAGAFFILLREGLEALLIVAALVAFLVKTKRLDGLRYIHFGWVSALIVGILTWWASVSLFNISGASREITEGIAAIVATVVLLYVGFWMHDKTSAAKWKSFIDDNMHKALSSGTLWTLSGLSFIAVYREAFETILFYQALWVQTGPDGQAMVFSGFITAAAVLVVVGWLIMRYSVRLPLRQFFAVTGWLMFILAIIFAGKGIAALQEAGVLMSYPVNFFRVDLLGIYPNLQGLLLQFVLIVLALFLLRKKSN
ncbi:MAG: cytochrome c/FTR1 family iron permease [Methylophaga sp.]|nr:cytochrome c/FTR1 family iron permease [Methylophaga sp.]